MRMWNPGVREEKTNELGLPSTAKKIDGEWKVPIPSGLVGHDKDGNPLPAKYVPCEPGSATIVLPPSDFIVIPPGKHYELPHYLSAEAAHRLAPVLLDDEQWEKYKQAHAGDLPVTAPPTENKPAAKRGANA